MSRNDDNTTGNLLDYLFHENYIKLFVIDLSRKKKREPQQINFTGKLEEDDGARIFFVAEKQQKGLL